MNPAHKLRVLVVDDDSSVCQVVSEYLGNDGHTFKLATNGDEGFEMFQAEQFDVVVTNQAMPGMSGDQLAAAIKRMSPDEPVILLTGFGDLIEAAGEQPANMDVMVGKLVALTDFRQALTQVVDDKT